MCLKPSLFGIGAATLWLVAMLLLAILPGTLIFVLITKVVRNALA